MLNHVVSQRATAVLTETAPIFQFATQSTYAQRIGDPAIFDFVYGNPHEMPLPSFSETLARWSVPQNKDWYAYKFSEPEAQKVVAETLRHRTGQPFAAEDVFLTNGAFAALAVALTAVVNPDDEVIFNSPPWFFYDGLIVASNGRIVRVSVRPDNFDLDLEAIAAAITPRTCAIIVNSPNNPTGKIYPPETLQGLAQLLTEAGEQHGRPIYLLSDEAYNRIVYDGRPFSSPTSYYPYSFLIYTYGKTLLTPGQRVGYLALPPTMPERATIHPILMAAQLANGYAFPNALLQHALSDLEKLSIDIEHLQYKRDWLGDELQKMGYELTLPEGTFYLLVRSPIDDDLAFCEQLAAHDIFCLPGSVMEIPGYFRISLTANDEMIERALPGFAEAIKDVRE